MSGLLGGLEVVAGLAIVLVVFYDLFQSVVLPRPAVGKIQIARIIIRPGWRMWRWVSQRGSRVEKSEARLAAFAPLALLGLFVVWAIALTVGYGLVILGLGDQFKPAIQDAPSAIYVSATTLVPLSYGDVVPEQGFARMMVVAESATGVALAALAITLLFSLYESFRAREEAVISLDALAGAPPSGIHFLETAAARNTRPELRETFDEWRRWSAMVLESHLAYPLLVYFRSSHDNEAWINSFGAVMDAAALVMSTVEDDAEGAARLMFTVGNHLVEDLTWVLRLKAVPDAIVEKEEYGQAVERLKKAGYRLKDGDGWTRFVELRARYGSTLNQVAHLLSVPIAEWVGDRSYLPHRQRRSLRAVRRKPTAINP
ncbi:MAG TPA: ion channel [Candidatus Dormibacteraeota bacterium]